jgi:hypothetical protein
MNKTIRIALSVAALSGILLLGATAAEATHSWGGYHWARTANPFTLKLGNNLTSSWSSYLTTVSTDWNGSAVLHTTTVSGNGSGSRCRATAGMVQVCNGSYGNNGWLGIAQIWISGLHITQGAVKVNDTYFKNSFYNNPNEKLHVLCQEVGHTFGLDHQSTDGTSLNTCMDYFSNTGVNAGSTLSTHTNQHDYDELALIYGHPDSFTTVSATKAAKASTLAQERLSAGEQSDLEKESEWGNETHRSKDGRESVFERDLGRGNKVLTHVFWTDQAAK